mmetsp:Transcript_39632/g.64064  ORF Transcript_39632/g.64064 Transcript_39632/m.64064 type:complete len:211 (-) Transcript_39632:317-949(-)
MPASSWLLAATPTVIWPSKSEGGEGLGRRSVIGILWDADPGGRKAPGTAVLASEEARLNAEDGRLRAAEVGLLLVRAADDGRLLLEMQAGLERTSLTKTQGACFCSAIKSTKGTTHLSPGPLGDATSKPSAVEQALLSSSKPSVPIGLPQRFRHCKVPWLRKAIANQPAPQSQILFPSRFKTSSESSQRMRTCAKLFAPMAATSLSLSER